MRRETRKRWSRNVRGTRTTGASHWNLNVCFFKINEKRAQPRKYLPTHSASRLINRQCTCVEVGGSSRQVVKSRETQFLFLRVFF